jgi:bis(5'-nucleosyl)-tetraphosphatase (symmetrical)
MAVFAIGDVQGCYDPLRRLLDEIGFDPEQDRLWFCGDLVNRGPKSLKVLRFVSELGDSAITVLGNHDLHLLALHAGAISYSPARFGTLEKILRAPDADELAAWLRQRPLAHYDPELDTLLVHAGLYPGWSVKKALKLSSEVESALQGKKYKTLLGKMYGNTPRRWSGSLDGIERLRFIINAFTRMRMLTEKRGLNFAHTGNPWRARRDLHPWYEFDHAKLDGTRVVFGHWSALGLIVMRKLVSLDSGCVWGRQLTAVRLDNKWPQVCQVPGQDMTGRS